MSLGGNLASERARHRCTGHPCPNNSGRATFEAEVRLRAIATPVPLKNHLAQRAYFTDVDVEFPLALDGVSSCPSIRAILVQVSHRLEVEIQQRFPVDCSQDSSPSEPTWTFPFHFSVPHIARQTDFEWRFALCNGTGSDCRPLVRLPFTAYPTDLLDPLVSWARNNILLVRDTTGRLQDWLDKRGIDNYERYGASLADSRIMTMISTENGDDEAGLINRSLQKGSVVWFREKVFSLPLLKVIDKDKHRLIILELPFISSLNDSPSTHKLLLEVFRLAQERGPA